MNDYPPLNPPDSFPAAPTPAGQSWPAHLLGDPMVDAARAAAMNLRGPLANRFGNDKTGFDADKGVYVADNGNWNALKDSIQTANPTDYQAAWTAINNLYNIGIAEYDFLLNAWNNTGMGDALVDQGDALPANQTQQKIQKYQQAATAYNAANNSLATVEGKHTNFASAHESLNEILRKYE